MLRRFLLAIISFSTIFVSSGTMIACQWDLRPKVLLITSYDNAALQGSYDQLVYHKLKEVYGNNVIATVFTHEEDNTYANILSNLITRFGLQKVFILDPTFNYYFPKISDYSLDDDTEYFYNSNLIRVMQQFSNVDFYFFNNQIANNVKVTDNIYEFRFDNPNKENKDLVETYGALNAEHFYQQLVIPNTKKIDTKKYNFETDENANWIIKIGVIDNIGNKYQQKVIDDFIKELDKNVPDATKYEIKRIKIPNWTLTYSLQNVQIVEQAAKTLYQDMKANFIFNSNGWFNNAIAYSASTTSSLPGYTKTIKFIANCVLNPIDYKYKNINYMLFSYDVSLDILDYTEDNQFPEKYQVLDDAVERKNAFAVNKNLNFVDAL